MKIAYASILSSDDPNSWSGLNRSIADCLRGQGCDVTLVGPLYSPRRAFFSKVRAKTREFSADGRFLWPRDHRLLAHYGNELARRLESLDYDVVFSPGTEAIAYLPESVRKPIAFWTDSPLAPLLNYYPWYTGLALAAASEAMETDNRALRRATVACYSSSWAVDAAAMEHGGAREKLHVLPFGPNLDSSIAESEIAELARTRLGQPWRFLFVGVDWARKGGDLALAVVTELNRRGHPAELDVVGCRPPPERDLPAFVRLHGFVNRREAAGRKQLAELFRRATFFIMPSQAEAFGVVFSEAAAHGLPTLATRTGGIPTAVADTVTGWLFPPQAGPADYVERILTTAQPARYEAMSRAGWLDFRHRLNWQTSGARLRELLETAVRQQSAYPLAS